MNTAGNLWISLGALPLIAYVIGSTPFGVIIARFHGADLRAAGSGNVGATNVARVIGARWGYLCFVCDVAKGLAVVAAAGMFIKSPQQGAVPPAIDQLAWLAVGFGAIAGHVFSFYLKFRGGKGVATALGVVLGMFPYFTYPGLVAAAVWVIVTVTSRYVSLGSIIAAGMFVPLFVIFNWAYIGQLWPMGAFAAVMAALIVARHRTNIHRLLAGTENKISR